MVKCELALAKLELRDDVKRLGLAAALLVIAAFTGCLILVHALLRLGLRPGRAGHLDPWAAFLIVAGVLAVLAALAILIVIVKVRGISGLRKTRRTVQADLALLQRDDDGTPARPAVEAG